MTQFQIENHSILNTYCNEIAGNRFSLETIDGKFVISKTKNGEIISQYKDPIWDFSPYAPIHITSKINFQKKFSDNVIAVDQAKRFTLLVLFFGRGKRASLMSIGSLLNIFDGFIVPFIFFAQEQQTLPKKILEDRDLLLKYSVTIQNSSKKIRNFCTFLKILAQTNSSLTEIQYKLDKDFIKKLNLKEQQYSNQYKQTLVIPSRILNSATKQRWLHVDAVEKNIDQIRNFFMQCLQDKSFGIADKSKVKVIDQHIVYWSDAIKIYQLNSFFKIYNITGKKSFYKFIHGFKITCKHLVHTYSGMREGEVFSLKNDCYKIENNTSIFFGITTKLETASKEVTWVTSKEIKRVIVLLNRFNKITADVYGLDFNNLPLFSANIIFPHIVTQIKTKGYQNILYDAQELPLNSKELQITQSDIDEIEEINFYQFSNTLHIGDIWNFATHQYRRSLVVYAIQSNIVSIGALQLQLKHLFREMTLYYGNGASYAKKIFQLHKKDISSEFLKLKPQLDTLAYIKNIICSEEQLFGIHGSFVENNLNQSKMEFKTYFLQNREKTFKQFKNGVIAYQETPLGGCISTKQCDSRLIRSLTACIDCSEAIIKQSKLNHVIEKQKEFLSYLNQSSIEYKTELEELQFLEKLKIKLEKYKNE